MHVLAARITLVTAAAAYIALRKALGFIIRFSLPEEHPFRVFQETVYQRFDDDFVRAAFTCEAPPRSTGGHRLRYRRVALTAVAVAVNGMLALTLFIPGVLLV